MNIYTVPIAQEPREIITNAFAYGRVINRPLIRLCVYCLAEHGWRIVRAGACV